jgi:Uma2 family endonuclease
MSITINPPAGPWTVADLDRLPDVGYRFEIHEGNLLMMSPVTLWHSETAERIARALRARGLVAYLEVGVKRSGSSTRVADVAVFHEQPTDLDRAFWQPKELALVVEVVSAESAEEDRVGKPRWYAQAAIPEYWRVEKGDDGGAVIYKYKLAHSADGAAAYIDDGVTTLANLEAGVT